jgi:plasmid stability protein
MISMITMVAPLIETGPTIMASIVIRNLDDDIKKRLKLAAARHGCSMEEEARQILKSALIREDSEYGLGTRINNLFRESGGLELPEIPRSMPRPSPFEEEPED